MHNTRSSPFFAKRLEQLKRSPTFSMTQVARELKRQGHEIITMTIGEPDFDTPDFIKKAAIAAMDKGYTKYTDIEGVPELKDAIIAKFKRDNDLTFERNQVMASTGAKQAIYNLLMATINPGDEVIIPSPYWVSYPDMVRLAEGEPKFVHCSAEENFKLTSTKLSHALSDSKRAKWIFLNSPNNPSGAVYNESELRAILDVLKCYPDVGLISDDVYEHIVYENAKFISALKIYPEMEKQIVHINSLSKSYAMTGWRLGYIAAHADLIQKMSLVQSQSTSSPNSISQYAAIAALTDKQGDSFLQEQQKSFEHRRNLLIEKLQEIDYLECVVPAGSFYIMVSCKALIGKTTKSGTCINNDMDFATFLLEKALVAVMPCKFFGADDYIRLSFATSDEEIVRACTQIKRALEEEF